jgi:hypothetical protein
VERERERCCVKLKYKGDRERKERAKRKKMERKWREKGERPSKLEAAYTSSLRCFTGTKVQILMERPSKSLSLKITSLFLVMLAHICDS